MSDRHSEIDALIGTLDESIHQLRWADRWRVRKRNKAAIVRLQDIRHRLLVDYAAGEVKPLHDLDPKP